jgi:outer membrane receptor for ferrienterochelin and colicins
MPSLPLRRWSLARVVLQTEVMVSVPIESLHRSRFAPSVVAPMSSRLFAVVMGCFLLSSAAPLRSFAADPGTHETAESPAPPNAREASAPGSPTNRPTATAASTTETAATNEPKAVVESTTKAVGKTELASVIDQESVGALLSMSLEDLINMKVTAASKQEESVDVAPSSVTVFKHDDIMRLGIRTVERLLNYVPGLQGTTDNGNGMFRISARGRSTPAHEYVLVLIDGQRMNNAYSGGTVDPLPVENIEQIEVIRGPGSALYGANAFLAVVNIKTNRKWSNVTVAVGDLNSRYFAANFVKDFGNLQVASFAKFYRDDGGLYHEVTDVTGRTVDARDPVQEVDGYLTLTYKNLTFHARHMERGFIGTSCCASYSKYSNRTDYQQSSARLGYHRAISEQLDLDAATSFVHDRSLAVAPLLPVGAVPDVTSGVTLAETYIFGTLWSGDTIDGNVDIRWRFLSRDRLKGTAMVGGNYEYLRATPTDVSSHDALWQYQGDMYEWSRPRMDRTTAAGYLQAKLELLSQIEVTAGARYDWYSDFGQSLNPRVALVYATPIRSHLKLMYGRAFRAPSFQELYDRPSRVTMATRADLRPEIANTFEVGYVQPLFGYAQGTVTYFHNKIDNIIQPPENSLPYRNLGSSTMQGIELELRTRNVLGFNLIGSYTHLFPGEERDSLIVPVDFGAVGLRYSRERWIVDADAVLRGDSKVGGYIAGNVGGMNFFTYEQPAYTLLGCQFQVEVFHPFKVFAVMENILDHRFQRTGSMPPPPGLLSRGRTVFGGLRTEL